MRTLCPLLLLLFIASPTFATTWQVPGDFPSIQAAITSSTHGDTILVAPGTYFEKIHFEGKAITVRSVSGASSTVIHGNQSGTVVTFSLFEGADSVLDGFTLENGTGTWCEALTGIWGHCGAGIFCHNASPTIVNNTIRENWSKLAGAGISITGDSSPLVEDNFIVSNRSKEFAGGIFCGLYTAPVLKENTLRHNEGGALLFFGSRPLVQSNDIRFNEAHFGSGIYALNCPSLTITGNTIASNSSFVLGGGILCVDSKGLLESNTIMDNTFGGIGCKNSVLSILKNTITANRGRGGITCSFDSDVRIEDNIIYENLASGDFSGGIWCGPQTTIKSNIIYGNEAETCGGGIWAYGTETIVNNLIVDNSASEMGGGICLYGHPDGYEVVKENIISMNSSDRGGGIWCDRFPSITNNTITANTATTEGGGICCEGGIPAAQPDHYITGNIICANKTLAGNGGGIGLLNCRSIVTDNVIAGNAGGNGGGMSLYNSSPTVTGNEFVNNCADNFGGGLYSFFCTAGIMNNTITDNKAAHGGGVMIREDLSSNVSNNLLLRNKADTGGGFYCITTDALLVNNTLAENMGYLRGGGFACRQSDMIISNGIFWNNTAPEGPEIWLGLGSSSSSIDISYSAVKGAQSSVYIDNGSTLGWGDGMISDDPLFIDAANGDYHILFVSPCRGTGINDKVVGTVDMEGDPRITLSTVDMGADEFHHHLYCTGDFTPEGLVMAHIVAPPGASPVILFLGSQLLPEPLIHPMGEFFLDEPFIMLGPLGSVSTLGVIKIPAQLPTDPPAPYDIQMQALAGDKLTNLFTMEVR